MTSALLPSISASIPGFHPRQLDNGSTKILRGWLDPRDPSKYTLASGRMTDLVNKVTGVAFSETAGSGPAFSDSGLNGGPCLVGASGDVLLSTEAALLNLWNGSSGHATHTIIYLAEYSTASFTGNTIGVGKSSETFFQSGGYGQATTKFNEFRLDSTGGNTSSYNSTPALTANTPIAHAWRYSGSAPTLRVGGASVTLTNTAGPADNAITTADRVALMNNGRSTLNGPMSGKCGPVILYSGVLSDAECDDASDWLRACYGLARLT